MKSEKKKEEKTGKKNERKKEGKDEKKKKNLRENDIQPPDEGLNERIVSCSSYVHTYVARFLGIHT